MLERPENGGPEAKKRTKMPILCSAGLTEQHVAAQRGSQNSTEKLGVAQISTERPSAAGKNHPKRNKTAWNEAQRPEAQRNATSTQHNRHATQYTKRNRLGNAKEPLRHGTMGNNKKGDNLSGCLL